jgi:hypothetical protein
LFAENAKGGYTKAGSKRFRALVTSYVDEYQAAKTKLDKDILLNKIVDRVRAHNSEWAHSLKLDNCKGWYEIGRDQAREKVRHGIREAITSRESATAKREKQNNNKLFVSKHVLIARRNKNARTSLVVRRDSLMEVAYLVCDG